MDKTTILSLAGLVAGVVLVLFGQTEIGSALLAATVGGFAVVKTKQAAKLLPFALGLGLLAGCGCFSGKMVDAKALEDPVEKLATRHDQYVQADESLTEVQRRVFLRTSELLRQIVAEALGK